MSENYDDFLENYYGKQKEKKRLRTERFSKYVDGEIPNYINTLEALLSTWSELEDVTTEKNREKAYFILRDKLEGFKLYFWKSGFVKKQDDSGRNMLFLNTWHFNSNKIGEYKMTPLPLELLIEKAHHFMISKKVFDNVEVCLREAKKE
jgi:hypothetical protein